MDVITAALLPFSFLSGGWLSISVTHACMRELGNAGVGRWGLEALSVHGATAILYTNGADISKSN